MKVPKVSIVIPTYNRAHLFKRSLECYAYQTVKDFEIILLDDSSTDDMQQVCRELAPSLGLDIKHFWFHKPLGTGFRDGCCQINYGIRASVGDLIITTAPEIMPGKNTIERMINRVASSGGNDCTHWFSAKTYLLSPEQQGTLDNYDWRGLGAPVAVRQIPEFYKEPPLDGSCIAFYPSEIDRQPIFGCCMFCGMTRKGWRMIGGQPETPVWGAPDVSFLNERSRRRITEITLQDKESYCVHQYHDTSHRDMDKCLANMLTGPWDFIRW